MAAIPQTILDALLARSAFIPEVRLGLGNPDWDQAGRRILIVRLSGFRDVQKSSSHILLFAETRRALPGAYIDFSFFPEQADRELLRTRSLPWFSGLVSGRSPADFDLVMISNAFGLELVNLPYLFTTAGMEPRSSGRAGLRTIASVGASGGGASGEREQTLVVLGGSNAVSAGSLLFGEEAAGGDSFVDGFFFGEGEETIGDLTRVLSDRGRTPEARLEEAETFEGFWRSGSTSRCRRRVIRPFPPALVDYPVLNTEEAGTARLQITAGCPGFCSFCLEGWDRRPYREANLESLLSSARRLKARSGADTLELYAFNFNTHAEIRSLLFGLNRIFRRVNLMSQRVDILAQEQSLLATELAADKRSFTLGIEGLSARLRRYYRKGLASEDLENVLDRLVTRGIRELKLFYIISGFEQEDDLAEFVAFAGRIKSRREAKAPGLRVLASAGFLVRLPFTPLQFAPLELDESRLMRIATTMKSSCESMGIEFRLASAFGDYLADQLLALGGAAMANWLERVPENGFVYDGTLSPGCVASLTAHARDAGMLQGDFVGEKSEQWRPPLGFIESEEQHRLLHGLYAEASACRDQPLCLGRPCSDCGACEEAEDRSFHVSHRYREPQASQSAERLAKLLAAKRDFPRVLIRVELPDTLAGATAQYRSSWVMRRLSAGSPEAAVGVFEAAELLFSGGAYAELLPSFCGLCFFGISGPDVGALRTAALSVGFLPVDELPEPSRVVVEVRLESTPGSGAYLALRAWLQEARVEVVEYAAEGARRLVPAARDMKKSLLYEAVIDDHPTSGSFSCRLSLGRKARLGDWLRRLGPGASRNAVIRVCELLP